MPKTIEVIKTIEMKPSYVPVPLPGKRCHHTNLSRDVIMSLITGPRAPVDCLEIRADNGKLTKRLVKLSSLIGYLDLQLEKQKKEREQVTRTDS